MTVTVLHISDLHRDAGSAITSETLLESLRLDRERYTSDGGVQAPDLAIVSGDIVYGVKADSPDSDAVLKQQYDEASGFLSELSEVFFAGDRERIVIVPGNHDVSHPHVLRSTAITDLPADSAQRAVLARQLSEDGSPWRWVWSDFVLRRIADPVAYNNRMEPFAQFYSDFYRGNRSFALDPSKQFAIHDFPGLGLVVAGLSSCCDNDIYSRVGRIHPNCVSGATRGVAEYVKRGRVPLAVWHHSLAGGPRESDYVDADVLQNLIDGGFVIGLHGHQHRPQFLEHRFTADRKRAMTVISAGTLCGGPNTLPTGRKRSYNLVVIDAGKMSGELHVREMQNSDFSNPVWGAAYVADFSGALMPFEIKAPPQQFSVLQLAGQAAELLRAGNATEAYHLVRPHLSEELARRVAVEALTVLKDWSEIQAVFNPPTSPPEFVVLVEALLELGRKPDLAALLDSDFARISSDAGVRQCIEMARSRLRGAR